MKTLGTTLFAIVLTMSPVAIVNAQTAAQPTSAPDIVTKSDLRQATAGLSKELKRTTAELKAELARQAKAQADAQRAADKAASDKRDADQKAELARQAKAHADNARVSKVIIGIICMLVLALIGLLFHGNRVVAKRAPDSNVPPAKSPTPEDLYGTHPSPSQVKKCLLDHKLKEGRFTIDLPNDNLVFEYRAVVGPEGIVTARFAGNGDTVTALDHLRKTAKKLYDGGNGPLQPIALKATGARLVG